MVLSENRKYYYLRFIRIFDETGLFLISLFTTWLTKQI